MKLRTEVGVPDRITHANFGDYLAIQKKNTEIEIRGRKTFLYQIFLFYAAYIYSQLCLILLHLLNVWRSDAALKTMFDFR